MTIRFAKQDEVATLQNLNDEVFVDNSKYDPDLKMDWAQSDEGKKYFTSVLQSSESICLIAEQDGNPIGYLVAMPKRFDYRLSKYIEIENMGVTTTSRSKGVGTALIYECCRAAKERGYQKVYVCAYSANSRAITFYRQCGFTAIDVSLEKTI